MTLYKWELDAVIKGIQMGHIDERERLAVLAASVGYFSNAERPKFKNIFDRSKEEQALEQAYNPEKVKATNKQRLELYNKVRSAFGGERSEDDEL